MTNLKNVSAAAGIFLAAMCGYLLVGKPVGLSAVAGLCGLLAAILLGAALVAPETNQDGTQDQSRSELTRLLKLENSLSLQALDGIPDPAVVLDAYSRVIAANANARDVIHSLPGAPITASIRAPGLLAAIEQAFRTGSQVISEFELPAPVERSLTVVVTPIDHDAVTKGVSKVLVVLRDKTAELQLAEMRADFVANASHELRTPLASLKGFVETLQGAAKDDPEARETFLAIMLDQTRRMSRLIDDLLSLSRIELREHLPPRDRIDLVGVVESAGQTMLPIAQAEGRKLVVRIASSPIEVRGDRDELSQVLQNLIQNAIKYGRPGGLVEVSVALTSRGVAVSVRDDGIGIATEHLPRLTERFYRVSAKESRERGGTGLGLAIVKHILNRHRGQLEIHSELGKGSTFTVVLEPLLPHT